MNKTISYNKAAAVCLRDVRSGDDWDAHQTVVVVVFRDVGSRLGEVTTLARSKRQGRQVEPCLKRDEELTLVVNGAAGRVVERQ
ncbi:hypothetical protein BaRGS_00038088, partial [Batillaria attramentaria]